jgi:hypothetical protein
MRETKLALMMLTPRACLLGRVCDLLIVQFDVMCLGMIVCMVGVDGQDHRTSQFH